MAGQSENKPQFPIIPDTEELHRRMHVPNGTFYSLVFGWFCLSTASFVSYVFQDVTVGPLSFSIVLALCLISQVIISSIVLVYGIIELIWFVWKKRKDRRARIAAAHTLLRNDLIV